MDPTVHSCATDVEMKVSTTISLGIAHKAVEMTGTGLEMTVPLILRVLEYSNISLNG